MSQHQIATKPGHRSSEHLYVMKNILSVIQKKKKAVIVSMWDLKKFFDSESLVDCMSELYKSNIKGKIYRLIYKMNQNIRISVKTPVGDTDFEDTGEGVGQGTVEGSIVSATSLDKGISESFDKDSDEDKINEKDDKELHRIVSSLLEFFHPFIFQDDVNKISTNVSSAQAANKKMEHIF